MPSQIGAETLSDKLPLEFQLAHTVAGEGDTLLLLHGSASNRAVWRRYVDPAPIVPDRASS